MTTTLRLRLACSAAAAALLLSPAAVAAQAPSSQAQSTYELAIPAGPLENSLVRFAEVTGVQLVYSADVTQGRRGQAVSGRLDAATGLSRLLAGTGLTYRFVDDRTVTIEPAVEGSVEGERVLGPVRIEGAQSDGAFGRAGQAAGVNGVNGSRDITATEGTGSFTSGALTIGSKAPRSILETPQSVSVITSERLEQQNINDFNQALQQAPGISFAQGVTNLDTTFYSRGFEVTSIQIDGGAPITTRFGVGAFREGNAGFFPQIDISQYDHVEILRGAAGLFNGYGDPSGTVNLVRKRPLDRRQVTLEAEMGSWSHYRAVIDATAPLAIDGRLRGRMVMTWQSNDHFYDVASDQKALVYGVVEYDLAPTTLVTLGASYTDQDSVPWYNGLPRYQTGATLGLPREIGLVFPWNSWDLTTTELFGSIEQSISPNWIAKLNVTSNQQTSARKVGFNLLTVNPLDGRGPRLFGQYREFDSDQLSVEASLVGEFNLFGQRQEVTLGVNRSDQDAGGQTEFAALVTSSSTAPYQPYLGGPLFCTSPAICPNTRIATPPINVFDFDPFDPLYTEPRNPLPTRRWSELGQVRTLAYANFRLTAFDRWHVETGLRWSRQEFNNSEVQLCTNTVTPAACVGGQVGTAHSPFRSTYSGQEFSWPPSVALSYDATPEVTLHLGYTDIYQDQSDTLDGDLKPLEPVTGENIELGVKWSRADGRINSALSVYWIEKSGFGVTEPDIFDRIRLNSDGSVYFDPDGTYYFLANDGTALPYGRVDAYRSCCYVQRDDQTVLVSGLDAELTGEIAPGWQVAASYTFSETELSGAFYGLEEGRPSLSIQPQHLYKLWTSYDFRSGGFTSWLAGLRLSIGINGQSEGFRSGSVCPDDDVAPPNAFTGLSSCLVDSVPFEFAVEPYTIVSGRVDYRLNDLWSAALNIENIFDETYYQSVGDVTGGNWYGPPRRLTLSLRSRW
ncbi:hypothetical protein BZG35_08635 [Brevundimonas sp. LM2]|uniref:TonB-dependent siderophore receptor n=1 Tax=Brevundimonas sp. LM2 TaxID=1938605 RepID=UPI000983BBEF|nr:TonB-dependent receptor [Brevundimonas sp. LM2]AQR61710.1 hypothetical protein BZG35_08635 [Brevundimonas sp. LM2]